MIAFLVGLGVLYTLQYVVGWPWYVAVPAAIVCYLAARYLGETFGRRLKP